MSISYQNFAADHHLSLKCERIEKRRDGLMSEMEYPMDHWRCKIGSPSGKSYTFFFSKGRGHKGASPRISEVLQSFKNDLYYQDLSFEDFCSELGYSSDSIEAYKVYKAFVRQNKKVREFFGENACSQLMEIED